MISQIRNFSIFESGDPIEGKASHVGHRGHRGGVGFGGQNFYRRQRGRLGERKSGATEKHGTEPLAEIVILPHFAIKRSGGLGRVDRQAFGLTRDFVITKLHCPR